MACPVPQSWVPNIWNLHHPQVLTYEVLSKYNFSCWFKLRESMKTSTHHEIYRSLKGQYNLSVSISFIVKFCK